MAGTRIDRVDDAGVSFFGERDLSPGGRPLMTQRCKPRSAPKPTSDLRTGGTIPRGRLTSSTRQRYPELLEWLIAYYEANEATTVRRPGGGCELGSIAPAPPHTGRVTRNPTFSGSRGLRVHRARRAARVCRRPLAKQPPRSTLCSVG